MDNLWKTRLRCILNTKWDPITGCPADEYDGYAVRITAMIRAGASDDDLFDYLERVESEEMHLRPDVGRLRQTVAAIRALSRIGN